MRRIGVVGKTQGADLEGVLDRLSAWASTHDMALYAEPDSLPPGVSLPPLRPEQEVDLLVSLGGDGTFLRAARLRAGQNVPVLGVNIGRLGFLTAVQGEGMEEALDRVVAGEHELDVRFTLEARVIHANGAEGRRFLALNDFAIHKGGVARVTHLDLSVSAGNGWEEIGSFSGDGVILSTPTGSTAYSLSAGGPIIVPDVDAIVVTPIAPHSLAIRPLVISADESVEVRPQERLEELVLTADGQIGLELDDGDRVLVQRSGTRVPMVRFPGQTFFATLRTKLAWAAQPNH